MIKVKLSEIVSHVGSIRALQEVKLPVKVSYKISRLASKLDPILESYNQKRNDLIKEYGEEQEDKSLQVTDPEKLKEFSLKLKELFDIEESIDWFEPIKLSELGDIHVEPKNVVSWIFEE